jgi:uncharacterized protein YbcI
MAGSTETQSPQRAISRGMVAIYKEYLGRGPVSASTTVTDEFVMTICSQGLTKAERKLVDAGEEHTVRELRRKFQIAMEADIKSLVKRETGRSISAFLSDHDVEKDIAIEVVLFESSNGEAT